MKKICVVGLGYIGLPTAITLALSGMEAVGVDVREELVRQLREGQMPIAEPGLDDALRRALDTGRLTFSAQYPTADVFIITVQTPVREQTADLSYVWKAAKAVGTVLREDGLVILESTVPPGTTKRMAELLSEASGLSVDRFHVAHCPERVIPGNILGELRGNDRIVGADTPEALRRASEVYQAVLERGKIHPTDSTSAELCKLVENTYRDINIAFANELSVVCQRLGVDVFGLIQLANCHPRVHVHTPGVGVGGHCIAVDPWFIHAACPDVTPLIATARQVNDGKPAYVAQQVAQLAAPSSRVCVLGLSYKPDTDDLRESPSLILCRLLRDRGYDVCGCEPNVHDSEIQGFANVPPQQALLCDFLVVTLRHKEFITMRESILASPHYDCVGL